MKDIRLFVNEARKKKEDVEPSDEFYASGGKMVKMDQLKKEEGKKASANTSRGAWAINEPTDDEAFDLSDKSKLTSNTKALLAKFRAEEDFFIQGKAGWAKTSIIKKMAASFHRSIITVYLDKAMASDLGGIPIPTRTSRGNAKQEYAMPGWAAEMLEHPDKQYLLFFDEMNQAPTDVQNALMPIVLEHEICGIKFDNFFVGAAGNLEEENRGVSALSKPLMSRFKPIIKWETNTAATWDETFNHLHKVWDGVFGKEFVEKFHENAELFANPREIEHKIFKFLQKLIKSGQDNSMFDADYWLNQRLLQLADKDEDDLTLTEKDKFAKLAEDIYDYMMSGGESMKPTKKASKNRDMIPEKAQELILGGMRDGFILYGEGSSPKEKYGISRENIGTLFYDDYVNAEQLQRYIKKLEAEGIKFYYETNADVKKDGLQLPPED